MATLIGVLRGTSLYDVARLARWARRGFWAIADYGLFAVSNFALNLLLARWLAPPEYGAFTVGFTIFSLVMTFQTGLFIVPMQVFGADTNSRPQSEYLGTVLAGHFGFTILAALVCLVGALGLRMAGLETLSPTVFSLGFAAPAILWLWLMRNAAFMYLPTHVAAVAGFVYLLLMVAGAYALHLLGRLTPASAMTMMGVSSVATALWLAICLRKQLATPRLPDRAALREGLETHWRFGRWLIGVTLLSWFTLNIWYIVLPAWGGLAASGTFRALVILILPAVFGLYGGSRVLIGSLVRARGAEQFAHRMRAAMIFSIIVAIVYWIVVGTIGGWLFTSLYGQYGDHASVLWVLGSTLPLDAAGTVFRSALLARERSDLVFWSYLVSAAAVTLIGIPLTLQLGYLGGSLGLLVANLASTGSMWIALGRAERGGERRAAAVELSV